MTSQLVEEAGEPSKDNCLTHNHFQLPHMRAVSGNTLEHSAIKADSIPMYVIQYIHTHTRTHTHTDTHTHTHTHAYRCNIIL